MHGIIHRVVGRSAVGLLPIAGRPLIVRQVQWLRSVGCERIIVEVDAGRDGDKVAAYLTNADSAGAFVEIVRTAEPAEPREVARRGGFPAGAPFVAVPADVLGDGDLAVLCRHADGPGVVAELGCEPSLPLPSEAATVRLFGREAGPMARVAGPGCGAIIASMHDALAVSVFALLSGGDTSGERSFQIPIHATEERPGVWIARGARISPDAEIVGPVLIGADAYVGAGARVGPNACIGDRAVIEPDSTVESAQVMASCMVPAEIPANRRVVCSQGMNSLRSGALREPFDDDDPRKGSHSLLSLAARLFATLR
jgi:hypothetical protein